MSNSAILQFMAAAATGAPPPPLSRIAFVDSSNDSLRTYAIDSGAWVQQGNSLSLSGIGTPWICQMASNRIAFYDSTNQRLRVYDFDGLNWAQVGSDFDPVGTTADAITALSGTDVALLDLGSGTIIRYTFNGTTWSAVGSGAGIFTGMNGLTALSSSVIAAVGTTSFTLQAATYSAGWSLTGSNLFIASSSGPTVSAMTSTLVARVDAGLQTLRAYTFNGSTWSATGSSIALPSLAATPQVTALSATSVAYIDSTNDLLKVYEFDGSAWTDAGINLSISGVGTPAIACLSYSPAIPLP